MAIKGLKCSISNLHAVLCFQLRKELNGKPLKEALDDQTLPLCWKGKKPFKSIRDVKKYFKPLALSFSNGWRAKSQFEIPPESYLIISVTPSHILLNIQYDHYIARNLTKLFISVQGQCLFGNSKWN